MAQQSEDMLKQHLDEHVGFLKRSAELYDQGIVAEAKRLAVSIRVLLHDTGNSVSLLGQLGMKGGQKFVDTATDRSMSDAPSYSGLVMPLINPGSAEYLPHLNRMTSKLTVFEDWWKATVIIDSNLRDISRQRLILTVANQDGGAHVDPKLNDVYADLSKNNSMGQMYLPSVSWEPTIGIESWEPIIGIEHASVRQIAHEVLCTLDPAYTPTVLYQKSGLGMLGVKFSLVPEAEKAPTGKIGRNSKCYCGSGKKYKRCHGAI